MTAAQGKILIIRGGAIGDFILTLPVLSALRTQFPNVHLEVLGYPHIAQLALAGGLVQAVRPIEARALAGFFAKDGTLTDELQRYFAGFAIIVSYLYDPDGIFQENVGRCSRAQFLVGPHRPDDQGALHATEVLLRPLQRLAIFDAPAVPRLPLTVAEHPRGGARSRPRLAVHPGSGSERKNWPEARWAELLRRLQGEDRWDFLLVGGEAEGERLDRLAALLDPERLQVARSLPLVELAQRLAACDAFAGHDSGITHLAVALSLPTVVLWGHTAETLWRPKGDRIVLIRDARGLEGIDVDLVLRNANQLLPG